MRDGTIGARYSRLMAGVVAGAAGLALWAGPAFAQAPAEAPAAALPAEAAPTPPPPPPPAPPPVPEAKPTATEAMPASRPDTLPPIDVGAWLRVGGLIQGSNIKKLNDWRMNNTTVELHAGGKIHKNVGVTLNIIGNMAGYGTSAGPLLQLEDAIIQFDPIDEFHVWAGHLLVMVDRDNSSGPFFMIPWNYPGLGFALGGVLPLTGAPAEGPFGRNNGVNVWGDVSGGLVSYFAGVYDNGNVASSPLFSGRLRLSLFDKETGFWGNGSYFGDKDILSFDVGAQFQKHGSANAMTMTDKDYSDINVDALFEKKLPGGAFATLSGAYYHYNVLDGGVSDFYYVMGAYASPVVGYGNIQPMVRWQGEKVKAASSSPWNLDVAVAYLIKGPALRLNATYSYTNIASGVTANAVQLNAQAIFF